MTTLTRDALNRAADTAEIERPDRAAVIPRLLSVDIAAAMHDAVVYGIGVYKTREDGTQEYIPLTELYPSFLKPDSAAP